MEGNHSQVIVHFNKLRTLAKETVFVEAPPLRAIFC
jgi:hypothetical protein